MLLMGHRCFSKSQYVYGFCAGAYLSYMGIKYYMDLSYYPTVFLTLFFGVIGIYCSHFSS